MPPYKYCPGCGTKLGMSEPRNIHRGYTPQELSEAYNPGPKKKKKLSAWQKFVKVNSKKPRFRYKSGKKKGRINLKALGIAYRKKRR